MELLVRGLQMAIQLGGAELPCCICAAYLYICWRTSLLCALDDQKSSFANIEHHYSVEEH